MALGYLVIRKDLPSQAPLHFEPIDFMIVPGQKMGAKLPIHRRNYDGGLTESPCNNWSFQGAANRNLPGDKFDCTDDRGGLRYSIESWEVLIAGEKAFH